ncbi:hypothetical protein M378DRAFT_172524 [Amanita muscaria Koide BX008]|uniref:Uncharacterized protein n=1 Tax=Amanita muscaria (strain Koide BX008) TaxID=946122 RepID=A0A0C2WIZ9_AMAMK|nr:hypothetical protein M378DRAFT_172524 [Amanita muscaria Koide BX008]
MYKGKFDYDGFGKSSLEIHHLGLLFYNILYRVNAESIPETPHKELEIPDNVLQLIQWCCADDPKERPTIDQVVQEMESWISLGQFTLST